MKKLSKPNYDAIFFFLYFLRRFMPRMRTRSHCGNDNRRMLGGRFRIKNNNILDYGFRIIINLLSLWSNKMIADEKHNTTTKLIWRPYNASANFDWQWLGDAVLVPAFAECQNQLGEENVWQKQWFFSSFCPIQFKWNEKKKFSRLSFSKIEIFYFVAPIFVIDSKKWSKNFLLETNVYVFAVLKLLSSKHLYARRRINYYDDFQ